MEVIKRGLLPDGTKILLEDWSEHNTDEYPDLFGYTIAVYPIAKNSSGFIRSGELFRLSISHNQYRGYTGNRILDDYEALTLGKKDLPDLIPYFNSPQKDMFRLGLSTIIV